MRILKVYIEGINHKSNVTFDLTQPETILIGENGTGKSTALLILYSLFQGRMTQVGSYVFERIIIRDEKNSYEFFYSDFHMLPDDLTTIFKERILINENASYAEYMERQFRELCSDLQQRDLYGQFLMNLIDFSFFEDSKTEELKQHFGSHFLGKPASESDDVLQSNFNKLVDELAERGIIGKIFPEYEETTITRFDEEVLAIINKYMDPAKLKELKFWKMDITDYDEQTRTHCYPNSLIAESAFVENINRDLYDNLVCVFSSMVNNTVFVDDYNVNTSFTITGLDFYERKKSDLYQYFHSESFESAYELLERMNSDTAVLKCDGLYFRGDKEEIGRFIIGLCDGNKFDIHSYIRFLCFDSDIAKHLNTCALDYARKYLNKLPNCPTPSNEDIKRLSSFFSEEVISYSNNYIQPLLALQQPFHFSIPDAINSMHEGYYKGNTQAVSASYYLLETYMDFYERAKNNILAEYKLPDDAKRVIDFIAHYIRDKSFAAAPGGLLMSLKTSNYTEGQRGKTARYMSLNSLSSGERKIVYLSCLAVSASKILLILDEPELSMSILWQKRLLNDLIDSGSFASMLVATHSPFIAASIEHQDYIHFLQ